MKQIILLTILLTSTLWSSAQWITQPSIPTIVGTNINDVNGEKLGHGTWVKGNFNAANKDAQIAQLQASNDTMRAQIAAIQTISPSTISPILTSILYVYHGSNYLGLFTNVFSIASSTQLGGTNYATTNWMSVDNGATWQSYALTNPVISTSVTQIVTNQTVTNILTLTPFISTNVVSGTNVVVTNYFNVSTLGTNFYTSTNYFTSYTYGGIELAVTSPSFYTTGAVSVASVTPFSAVGRLNTFAGQTWDFSGATVAGLALSSTNVAAFNSPSNGYALRYTNGLLYWGP